MRLIKTKKFQNNYNVFAILSIKDGDTLPPKFIDEISSTIEPPTVIGRLKNLTDIDVIDYVHGDNDDNRWFRDYGCGYDNIPPYTLETPLESFITLLIYEGVNVSDGEQVLIKIK